MTDFRGNPYTVGTTIVYARMSGRSCELQEAVTCDIWRTYRDRDTWTWKRYDAAAAAAVGPITENDLEWRVRAAPTGRGSRGFFRASDAYVEGPDGSRQRVESAPKPAALTVIDNIMVAGP
ncbi:hypothetical protein [Planomonospora sp. ID82291]|uniref:hypothetical protein n=1 Tax=Planomonospora sp. ID82291 TaxID=2738136 RepID=UPI0018C3559B|nr:hypothetical protein [Planomonospora sp. ID82291]MBG0818349.1 hypothetical protein [Planomonospora sp. ID82291]